MPFESLFVRLAMALGAVPLAASAQQTLHDPMQLPAFLAEQLSPVIQQWMPELQPQATEAPDAAKATATVRPLKLEQVWIRGSDRFAVIDGQRLALGEYWGDWALLRIEPNAVVLQNEDETLTLSLFPRVAKQSVATQAALARSLQGLQ